MIEVSVVVSGCGGCFPYQVAFLYKAVLGDHVKDNESLTTATGMRVSTFSTLKLDGTILRSAYVRLAPRFPFPIVFVKPSFV